MKTKTCPHCKYTYSRWEYTKNHFFSTFWSERKCIECDKLYKVNAKRRIMLSIALGVIILPYLCTIDAIGFLAYSTWIELAPFALLLLSLHLGNFDNFELVSDHKSKEASP